MSNVMVVIPSEVEESRCNAWKVVPRDSSTSLRMTGLMIRASSFGFTIMELLVVITIIIVLAGLILATTGYVQKKGARSRAEAEIAAMSAALENYKADNGTYPRDNAVTDTLNARTDGSVGIAYQ